MRVFKAREVLGSTVIALVVAVVLSACSGDDAKPSTTAVRTGGTATAPVAPAKTVSGGQTDVCSLMTYMEATQTLGQNITDRAATTPPVNHEIAPGLKADLSACAYSSTATGVFVKLDLSEAKGRGPDIKQFTQTACAGKDEIAGLGDFACWYSDDHKEIKLAKNGALVDIKSGTASGDALLTLAQKVVARLP